MKWHQLIEADPRIGVLHRACRAIHAAEDLWVEGVSEDIFIDLEKARVYLPMAFPEDSGVVEEVRDRYGDGVEIHVDEPPPTAVGLGDAYSEYVSLLNRVGAPFLKEVKRLTSQRGSEHAFIVFLDHEAGMLLEGEGDRIVLPEVRSCAFIHTHPGEYCYPSPNDIRSSIGFFSTGGIVEEILAQGCRWVIWRSWLLAEEDIEALFETAERLEKAYRGRRLDPFQPLRKTVFKHALLRE